MAGLGQFLPLADTRTDGRVAPFAVILSIGFEPLRFTQSSPVGATYSRRIARASPSKSCGGRVAGSADVILPKKPLTAGAGSLNLRS
jgi:hypothetical protein